jgi:flavin reductase (DIM6/NTAB) family NADH-FMN oxidoreductase RutF
MKAAMSIEPRRFRDLMAAVAAPVTVVTTMEGGRPYGATVSSFASLSLEPPLITVAFDNRSSVLARVLSARTFGVNLLGCAQADLAVLFARRDVDRFAGTDWHADHGLPRLAGAAGWVVCELRDVAAGGDHRLLLGHVTAASRAELPPLIYAHRTFGTHSRYHERPRPLIIDQIAACAR